MYDVCMYVCMYVCIYTCIHISPYLRAWSTIWYISKASTQYTIPQKSWHMGNTHAHIRTYSKLIHTYILSHGLVKDMTHVWLKQTQNMHFLKADTCIKHTHTLTHAHTHTRTHAHAHAQTQTHTLTRNWSSWQKRRARSVHPSQLYGSSWGMMSQFAWTQW